MRLDQCSVSTISPPPAPKDEWCGDEALGRAHATLAAGCAFLLRTVEARTASPADVYARLQGNRLRELDRFLSILLDETARALKGTGHDAPGFGRMRNTPNKLQLVTTMQRAGTGAMARIDVRLRAIGRISACLNHCSGVVRAPGMHRDVLLAGGHLGEALAVSRGFSPASDRLRLTPETLDAISSFYRGIGDQLLVQAHEVSAQP
ncbi:hypothetical protein BH10PSE13_BH10PSE13_19020 [soil metagenome]